VHRQRSHLKGALKRLPVVFARLLKVSMAERGYSIIRTVAVLAAATDETHKLRQGMVWYVNEIKIHLNPSRAAMIGGIH